MRDIRPKRHTHTPLTNLPAITRTGICPQQITHNALFRGLPHPIGLPNILQLHPILREYAAMADKHLLVDDVGQWELAEELGEGVVDFGAVFRLDFAFEAVDHVDGLRLVVAAG